MALTSSSDEFDSWASARGPEAVQLHSTDHKERLLAFNSDCDLSNGPGLLLKLSVCCQDLSWITSREVWTARFRLYIMHETRGIQVIDWFDTFPQAPGDVRAWPTEIQTGEVDFAGVIRWNVNGHFTSASGATPPRRRER